MSEGLNNSPTFIHALADLVKKAVHFDSDADAEIAAGIRVSVGNLNSSLNAGAASAVSAGRD